MGTTLECKKKSFPISDDIFPFKIEYFEATERNTELVGRNIDGKIAQIIDFIPDFFI